MKKLIIIALAILLQLPCYSKGNKQATSNKPTKKLDKETIDLALDKYITEYLAAQNSQAEDMELEALAETKESREYVVGDLNKDGYEDIVCVFWYNYANVENIGSGTEAAEVAVCLNKAGQLKYFQSIEAEGGRCAYTVKKIEKGYLYSNTKEYDEDDGMCCPSINVDIKYHLRGNKIIKEYIKQKNTD